MFSVRKKVLKFVYVYIIVFFFLLTVYFMQCMKNQNEGKGCGILPVDIHEMVWFLHGK